MTELLPTEQAHDVQRGLLDYLTTTFALADQDARLALSEFLEDPIDGLFKGPFLRLRLPFRPAEPGWESLLGWRLPYTPHRHQAAAFLRLRSSDPGVGKSRPLPTLVTTGTGSGKTEAFLYPILDHVLHERRAGRPGMKALILYPMNALANDQAGRLASLLTSHEELKGITAGLYTGQQGETRTRVSAAGLINDRAIIRDEPPDILLTNYKMLDQLLLRPDDQPLWKQSALSLQYLVLDEFHTYDGAQGTDVAMLLRRLGLALKSHWPAEGTAAADAISEGDRQRPLGRVTPVATSATLGDKGDPAAMVAFAETVFGEPFDSSSVVTESRVDLAEWVGDAESVVAGLTVGLGLGSDGSERLTPAGLDAADFRSLNERLDAAAAGETGGDVGRNLAIAVLAALYDAPEATVAGLAEGPGLLVLAKAHPLVQRLVTSAASAVHVDDLAAELLRQEATTDARADVERRHFLLHLVGMLSHVRATAGLSAANVDLHLWVRELTRIDRVASSAAKYLWSDDGAIAANASGDATEWEGRSPFPAVYCRHCGRSGWGVGLSPVGLDLDADDANIRRNHAAKEGRFRALLYAPLEADHAHYDKADVEGLRWFSVKQRAILVAPPSDDDPDFRDGWILPVLALVGPDADEQSRDDTCPSCLQDDGIRFLGSAIATLLSVTLSTLFNDPHLDGREKKALVFTDSVQDAAHRAGFVQSRSHTLTLRSVLQAAIDDEPRRLDEVVSRAMTAADDPAKRYRLVPPTLAERPEFEAYWNPDASKANASKARVRVASRLLFDTVMEFGLQSRIGRTLEATGSAVAEVSAPSGLAAVGRAVLARTEQDTLDGLAGTTSDTEVTAWVRGVLERMRERGAIDHPWFRAYVKEDGARYRIWGGRPKGQGMPAFPKGRSAPAFPRVGPALANVDPLLDPVTSAQSWYARWTARCLQVSVQHGARLAKALLERLAHDSVLTSYVTNSQATVYAVPHEAVLVSRPTLAALTAGECLLECAVCRNRYPGTPTVVAELDGAPCLLVRCPGRLKRAAQPDNYYRRLYGSGDPRRVVAREHSSLLSDETRVDYETRFKAADGDPTAPNVLVATPTLEMGIDIGDLSAVMLASLPRTVASYLQRVGRAGRLTGNALNVAFVTGRGEHLPRLGDPLSVIDGQVRPPATYLNAEEILQRQYTAHLADILARTTDHTPRRAAEVLGRTGPGSFLGDLIALAEGDPQTHLDRFVGAFDGLTPSTEKALREWATPVDGPGTSGLAAHIHAAAQRWATEIEELKHRRQGIEQAMPELQKIAELPAATDDDKRAARSALAALKMTKGITARLRDQFWIGALEEQGVLPNYTLVDDAVRLDVAVTWIDPDTQEYESDQVVYQRGSANALREFAPGAVFYAAGLEIEIDSVDLGYQGTAVRPWAFCPDCGYAVDRAAGGTTVAVPSCPRCGGKGIADTKQHVDVVELTRVSAELRRDEAAITDRRDDRRRERFSMFVAADVRPESIVEQWYVEDYDFGLKYLRRMEIRWLNAGKAAGYGAAMSIGGVQRPANLFRVCEGCGKLDRAARTNRPDEHRAWCRYRKNNDEPTKTLGLMRTLRTQGVLLRLPRSVTIGDLFAVPSLSAALLLGLREQLGGTPDHLQVAQVADPTYEAGGGRTPEALLVHDTVPGGTGYLAELADPARLWDLLHQAYVVVRDCSCADEPRLACHRCLLPFAGGMHPVEHVSRQTAERHLRAILCSGRTDVEPTGWDTDRWATTTVPPGNDSTESHLEQHFRKVFRDRVTALGATVKDIPGAGGNTLRLSFPGGTRVWTLEPQVPMGGVKPDFVLRSGDPNVPLVAIFTDGKHFHASPAYNRLADDAAKRRSLRDQDVVVLAVTARDVEAAADPSATVVPPSWFRPDVVASVHQSGQFPFGPQTLESLTGGPFAFLLGWLQKPEPTEHAHLGDVVPLFFMPGATPVLVPAGGLPSSATLLLDGGTTAGESVAMWHRLGPLGVLARVGQDGGGLSTDLAVVLDDRDEALTGHDFDDAWREWLRISNAVIRRVGPVSISTVKQVLSGDEPVLAEAVPAAPAPAAPAGPTTEPVDLPSGWRAVFAQASPLEADLLERLTRQGRVPVPVLGHESADGIPIDVAWPDVRVAVLVDADPQDCADLEADGWTVLAPDVELLLAALATAGALEEGR